MEGYREYSDILSQIVSILEQKVSTGANKSEREKISSLQTLLSHTVFKSRVAKELKAAIDEQLQTHLQIKGRNKEHRVRRKKTLSQIRNLDTNLYAACAEVQLSQTSRDVAVEAGVSEEVDKYCRDFQAATTVTHMQGIYVLGCFDRKKTVFAQQCRAFSMAAMLKYFGYLHPNKRIAIVGGGIAGITLSAALHKLGKVSDVFERTSDLMHIQERSNNRFLSPHIYDWPSEGSTNSDAGLPIMNWNADYAASVRKQLIEQYGELEISKLAYYSHEVTDILPDTQSSGKKRYYLQIDSNTNTPEPYDAVIIAVGFGLEPQSAFGVKVESYWNDITYGAKGRYSKNKPQKVLISGVGDGGLIDTLGASIKDFAHHDLLDRVPELFEEKYLNQIKDIENEALIQSKQSPGVQFDFKRKYKEVTKDWHWKENLIALRIPEQEITLHSQISIGFYSINSSLLNRILVHLLEETQVIKQRVGTLNESMVNADLSNGLARYTITWGKNDIIDYDRLVVRHGIHSQYVYDAFPALEEGCADMDGRIADLDLASNFPESMFEMFT